MVKSLMDRMPLNDGFTIPESDTELGTWPMMKLKKWSSWPSCVGIAGVDAGMYGNEVGVKLLGIPANSTDISRDDIFVVTKLGKDDMGFEKATDAIRASYDRLGLKYIDLF